MAELGQTTDPRQLIPGDPAAIEDNVVAIRGRGHSMESAGDNLRRIDTGAWTGEAGEAFRDKFSYEPPRWHKAADAFDATATALDDYASTLRWAQRQATEAIHIWQAGEATTAEAKAQHDADIATADQQNRAHAVAGIPAVVQVPPFTDPGEAQRQEARSILDRARQQLTEAGDRAAATIHAKGDDAPEKSFWEGVGDFFEGAGDFLGDVAVGVWDTLSGTAELLWALSPHNLITDPAGYGETWAALGQTAISAVTNPVEFGKQLIGWEHWKNGEPGRAIGQIAGGFLLGGGAGKIVSTVSKARKARTRRKKLPHARKLISGGKQFQGRRLPKQASPNSVLYKRDPQSGEITNYTVYDDAGNATKRVDLTGRPHGGVPTPHVVEHTVHRNPETGQVFVREEPEVRPATPEEIP